MTMKTLVCEKNGSLAIKEVPMPKIGPKQALVKMIASGICGTDVKIIHQKFKGIGKDMYPLMLGHEGVAKVVEIGADVKGVKPGDNVILPFVDHAPNDFDGIGSAWGAFSEYGVITDALAYPDGDAPDSAYAQTKLTDDLDAVDAVTIVTFREVLSSIYYFGIKPADSIVIFGCGPVGLTFIKLLSLLGFKDIVAIDIMDDKLKSATEHGATAAINSARADAASAVRQLYPNGVKYTIDAVGLPAIANIAMEILADRGKVLCYGVLEKDEITIDFSKMSYNWGFVSQQFPDKLEEAQTHDTIVQWIKEGKLVMKDFISDYFEFDDALIAFEKYLNREVLKKGIIVYK